MDIHEETNQLNKALNDISTTLFLMNFGVSASVTIKEDSSPHTQVNA